MIFDKILKIAVIVWLAVGLGLSVYLVYFPMFMKKNISEIISRLERIAKNLEKKNGV